MSKVLHEWTGKDGQSWRLMDHESGPYAVGERAVDVMDEAAINALHEDDDFEDAIMAELARVAAQVATLTAERDALRNALRAYGAHKVTCDPDALAMTDKERTCTCGYRAALEGGRPS